jgi:uncharacterized protein DUF6916
MTSRRKFLKQGTLGALAAGFTLGLGDKIIGRTVAGSSTGLFALDRAAFSSQLHTTFVINDGSRKVPLKLIEVADLGSKKNTTSPREAFSLVFRGSNSSPLKQETYSIDHAKLGRFSMLMVPIFARDNSMLYYEINVNRLHG